MKLWILAENTACAEGMLPEHGLSLYMETGSRRILFDMGQTDAFARNAARMGVNLEKVDTAVLSHGHYDHGGGMAAFLEINTQAPVYVSAYAFCHCRNSRGKYIGLDKTLEGHPRLMPVKGERSLGPGLTLYAAGGPLEPVAGSGMTVLEPEGPRPEDFRHEQYLLIREGRKRILFSGCSHRGIREIAARFRPDVLVGGFHLMGWEEEQELADLAQGLLALPTRYYTGHCTGERQFAFLKTRMGQRLEAISTGLCLEL